MEIPKDILPPSSVAEQLTTQRRIFRTFLQSLPRLNETHKDLFSNSDSSQPDGRKALFEAPLAPLISAGVLKVSPDGMLEFLNPHTALPFYQDVFEVLEHANPSTSSQKAKASLKHELLHAQKMGDLYGTSSPQTGDTRIGLYFYKSPDNRFHARAGYFIEPLGNVAEAADLREQGDGLTMLNRMAHESARADFKKLRMIMTLMAPLDPGDTDMRMVEHLIKECQANLKSYPEAVTTADTIRYLRPIMVRQALLAVTAEHNELGQAFLDLFSQSGGLLPWNESETCVVNDKPYDYPPYLTYPGNLGETLANISRFHHPQYTKIAFLVIGNTLDKLTWLLQGSQQPLAESSPYFQSCQSAHDALHRLQSADVTGQNLGEDWEEVTRTLLSNISQLHEGVKARHPLTGIRTPLKLATLPYGDVVSQENRLGLSVDYRQTSFGPECVQTLPNGEQVLVRLLSSGESPKVLQALDQIEAAAYAATAGLPQVARSLNQPTESVPLIAREYLDPQQYPTLPELITTLMKPLPEDEMLEIALQCLDVLDRLHDHNLVLHDENHAQLRWSRENRRLGIQSYDTVMGVEADSPEQKLSDLYRLGETLFHLATAKPLRILSTAELDAGVWPDWTRSSDASRRLILTATHPDPSRRFQSTAQFITAVKEARSFLANPASSPASAVSRAELMGDFYAKADSPKAALENYQQAVEGQPDNLYLSRKMTLVAWGAGNNKQPLILPESLAQESLLVQATQCLNEMKFLEADKLLSEYFGIPLAVHKVVEPLPLIIHNLAEAEKYPPPLRSYALECFYRYQQRRLTQSLNSQDPEDWQTRLNVSRDLDRVLNQQMTPTHRLAMENSGGMHHLSEAISMLETKITARNDVNQAIVAQSAELQKEPLDAQLTRIAGWLKTDPQNPGLKELCWYLAKTKLPDTTAAGYFLQLYGRYSGIPHNAGIGGNTWSNDPSPALNHPELLETYHPRLPFELQPTTPPLPENYKQVDYHRFNALIRTFLDSDDAYQQWVLTQYHGRELTQEESFVAGLLTNLQQWCQNFNAIPDKSKDVRFSRPFLSHHVKVDKSYLNEIKKQLKQAENAFAQEPGLALDTKKELLRWYSNWLESKKWK